jgi:serine/threonine protein kinase/WD40 repeat protein
MNLNDGEAAPSTPGQSTPPQHVNDRGSAEHNLCSSCRRQPRLAAAPFCSACLLAPAAPSRHDTVSFGGNGHLPRGTVVGQYEIVELLGEGGFSEVYSAVPCRRSTNGGRPETVALKLIKRGMDSREIVSRFRAEHRTVESLSHPSIVGTLQAGLTEDGRPYFTMPQVDGLPITDYCEIAGLPLRERLQLFLMCCDAVQHAHWKGVLHRDLKPSNILVEETPDGPIAKIIDFGIAKALEPVASGMTLVTQLGQVLGTPTYMSPEQAAGSDDADTRSDVYSLGAVLYEMLTGCPPFNADVLSRLPPQQWGSHMRQHPPLAPSVRLQAAGGSAECIKEYRGSLDNIIAKAMAAEPEQRYRSAAAFADDIRNFVVGRPVSAHPPSLSYVVRSFVRRNRWPVAFALAVLAGIIASAAIGTVLAVQARRAEADALREKSSALAAEQRASEARDRSEHQNYQAAIETAMMHLENKQPFLAGERLRATQPALRGWEWGHLMAAIPAAEAVANTGLSHAAHVAASPDGELAAVAERGTVRVVDLRRDSVVAEHTFDETIRSLAASDDKLRLAAVVGGPGSQVLHVLQLGSGERWSASLCDSPAIGWEPASTGGALLAVCGNGPEPTPGRLVRFDPASGVVLNERAINRYKVDDGALVVGRAGKLAVVATSYKDLEIVALPTLETVSTDHDEPLGEITETFLLDDTRDLLVVARGSRVFAGSATDAQRRSLAGELTTGGGGEAGRVRHVNWLADGRWFAAAERTALVQGEQPQVVPAPAAIAMVGLTGGRRLVLTTGGRLEIRTELLPPSEVSTVGAAVNESEGRATAFTPDGKMALFQSWRRDGVRFVPLDKPDGTERMVHFGQQPNAEWSGLPIVQPDGSVLVAARDRLIAVRASGDSFDETEIPHSEAAWSADVSPRGRHLAIATATGVRLLDQETRSVVREWALAGGPFRVALLRDDASALIALGADSVLHYLPRDGAPVALPMPLRANRFYPAAVAFRRDQHLLAGALAEGGYAVYDVSRLPEPPQLLVHAPSVELVTALAFSPGTRRLAVASDDHRIRVWNWRQKLPLLTFPVNSTCASIAFSPDGKWMANTDYAPSLVLRRSLPLGSGTAR